jgi:hypothetical protein
VQEFAKENPHLARKALQPPPLRFNDNDGTFNNIVNDLENMDNIVNKIERKNNSYSSSRTTFEDYLIWRGWDVELIENPMTNALLSHALTFPLTLASHVSHFMSSPVKESIDRHVVNICCVGSRAEANLPDEYWREFLIASNYFFLLPPKMDSGRSAVVYQHWNIDCIGPEVKTSSDSSAGAMNSKSQPRSRCIPLHQGRDGPCITLNLHQEYLHNHVLHDVYQRKQNPANNAVVQETLDKWDGFVLFNPGIGHPHLKKSWKPTMEFILKTQKNIIITAHSNIDKARDEHLLKRLIMLHLGGEDDFCSKQKVTVQRKTEDLVEYRMNPFASKMLFEDPFATDMDEKLVRPNHSVCQIRFDTMQQHSGVLE